MSGGEQRGCFNTRSVGQRPSENTEGKEAEAGNSTERVVDAGRRSHSALAAGRSQDGVLKQPQRRGIVRFDGGSSGNPGPAASAFVIEVDGMVVLEEGHFIGRATNNEAEYDGLIRGLERALDLHITDLVVLGDSELVIFQMKGDYKVRKPHLKPLHEKARELAAKFSKVDFQHVPREENKAADKLLRKALKEKHDVME